MLMIGESHSGDIKTLWCDGTHSYVQGSAQTLVIIHCPHVSSASLKKGWRFKETYSPTCFAATYLVSLGIA